MKRTSQNGNLKHGQSGTTVIAANTRLTGEIRGKGKYVVCGNVVGDGNVDGAVTVAAGGHWKGKLTVGDLFVAGTIEGEIIARDRVKIAPGARIAGTISCFALQVAAGAVIDGPVSVRGERRRS